MLAVLATILISFRALFLPHLIDHSNIMRGPISVLRTLCAALFNAHAHICAPQIEGVVEHWTGDTTGLLPGQTRLYDVRYGTY
jgi:hypothetical protein